ncbi:sigma 54-interacting transcriptional regulator [Halanaerobaculum tunisiense]
MELNTNYMDLDRLNHLAAQDIMSNKLLTIDQETSLDETIFLMLGDNVTEAVVTNDDELCGIVTFNDFADLINGSDRESVLRKPITSFIDKEVITVNSGINAIEAKNIMKEKGIGRLPVLENGQLIGIIRINNIINNLYNRFAEMNDILFNILNTLHEAVCIIDREGKVIMWDDQSEKLYGIKKETIIDKQLEDHFPNALLLNALNEKEAKENAYHNPKEGVYTIISAMPLFVNGELVGAVSTDRDVTEVTNLSSQLRQTKNKLTNLQQKVNEINGDDYPFSDILGKSEILQQKIEKAEKVARTNTNVLITGDSGTGKELFANSIHQASDREGAFITVNCSAIPKDLFESEMFGYVEGGFTGASKGGKEGYFELADGGTLFLDEIGDMPMFMQSKLLRVLQEGKIKKIGAEEYIEVDVRIVSATNCNLKEMIAEEEFREDLFYRLNVIKLKLPNLKERKEDIPILINHFMTEFCEKNNLAVPELTSEVLTALVEYKWQGNVRELQNVVEHFVVFSENGKVTLDSIPDYIAQNSIGQEQNKMDLDQAVRKVEINTIKKAMELAEGNKSKAAKILNIPRSTLYYKIKYYDIDWNLN